MDSHRFFCPGGIAVFDCRDDFRVLAIGVRRRSGMEIKAEEMDMRVKALQALVDEFVATRTRDEIVELGVAFCKLTICTTRLNFVLPSHFLVQGS